MTVDVTRPEGREVLDQLVRSSDGFMENNVPINMEKLGLTWERLSAVNPNLIMVSMPGFGLEGPYKNYRAMGSHAESLLGHPLLRAYPNADLDHGAGGVPPDAASGIGGAFAFLMGLRIRRRTGKGVFIEVPMTENFVPSLGNFVMDYTMNGRVQTRMANQHPVFAPHNAYPCKGENRWIAIACTSDQQWRDLCDVLGMATLAEDPRFRDMASRLEKRNELDDVVSQRTRDEDANRLMYALQGVGISAGVVMNEQDALDDPHLNDRGYWETLDQPEVGTHQYVGPLFRMAGTPNHLRRHAPRLGEDNEYVYKQILGFSDEKYQRFEELGHIGMDYDPSVQ